MIIILISLSIEYNMRREGVKTSEQVRLANVPLAGAELAPRHHADLCDGANP
jgi:hypothetical protein